MVLGGRADALDARSPGTCAGSVASRIALRTPGLSNGFDRLHPRHRGLRRDHLMNIDVVHALVEFDLLDVALVDAVHLLGGKRGGHRRGVVAEIDELHLVEIGPSPSSRRAP